MSRNGQNASSPSVQPRGQGLGNRFVDISLIAVTCEGGTIARSDDVLVFVITPNDGVTEVSVEGLPDWAKVAVPPSITRVNGVYDDKIRVKSGAYDITGAFTVSGGAIALNANGSVTIDDEVIPVKPTIGDLVDGEPFVVGDQGVEVTIRSVSGLKYVLWRGETSQALSTMAMQAIATGTRITLTDIMDSASPVLYYQIGVLKPSPTESPKED